MHISAYEARLERVAEELMGRRKWKHFQVEHTKSHMSTESLEATTATIATTITATTNTLSTINNTQKEDNLKAADAILEDRLNLEDIQEKHSESDLLKTTKDEHMQKEQICAEENEKEHHKESSQINNNNNINSKDTAEIATKTASGELAENIKKKSNNIIT